MIYGTDVNRKKMYKTLYMLNFNKYSRYTCFNKFDKTLLLHIVSSQFIVVFTFSTADNSLKLQQKIL